MGEGMIDWCEKCEEMMQPYLDGALSDAEVEEAEHHLADCQLSRSATASRSACGITSRRGRRADVGGAEGEARRAPHAAPLAAVKLSGDGRRAGDHDELPRCPAAEPPREPTPELPGEPNADAAPRLARSRPPSSG